ncbi:MAG: hypothetical protein QM487_11325 [Candidatus Marithrix sp.]
MSLLIVLLAGSGVSYTIGKVGIDITNQILLWTVIIIAVLPISWHFLIGLQNKFNPRAGGKSLNSLGDMGGDGTGGQENELKNPNN